jgi:hypothetical protein
MVVNLIELGTKNSRAGDGQLKLRTQQFSSVLGCK